jgi:predicted ATPase
MLMGRDAEAAKIASFLGELDGGSRVLLIEGEAGIGKTILLREGHAIATQVGMMVLSAFPVESEIPLEFAGLTDLVEKVPAAVIDGLPLPQRQVLRQEVLRTVPQVRAADPRTMATAVLTLLRHLASKRSVLVVVDDLPWRLPDRSPSENGLGDCLSAIL